MARKTKKERIKEFLTYLDLDATDVKDYDQLISVLSGAGIMVKIVFDEDGDAWLRVGDKVAKKVERETTIHKFIEAAVYELT